MHHPVSTLPVAPQNHAAKSWGRPNLSPQAYLAQHELTALLKRKGLSDAQLNSVHFRHDAGDPYSAWRVRSVIDWPTELIADMKIWCALRWLIMDNPPASRDREDASNDITFYLARPVLDAGRKFLDHAKKAGMPSKREAERKALELVEAALALRNKNPKRSQTWAVEQAARGMAIPTSTAWRYWKMAKPPAEK